jgi:hypothetical protein
MLYMPVSAILSMDVELKGFCIFDIALASTGAAAPAGGAITVLFKLSHRDVAAIGVRNV